MICYSCEINRQLLLTKKCRESSVCGWTGGRGYNTACSTDRQSRRLVPDSLNLLSSEGDLCASELPAEGERGREREGYLR